jgi:hypothetical protein
MKISINYNTKEILIEDHISWESFDLLPTTMITFRDYNITFRWNGKDVNNPSISVRNSQGKIIVPDQIAKIGNPYKIHKNEAV